MNRLTTLNLAAVAALGVSAAAAHAANLTYTGAGKWETTANWSPETRVPIGGDTALIDGDADVLFDADTWAYLSSNSLLNGGTTGEYRTNLIRVANFGTDVATFDFGNDSTIRTTSTSLTYIGSGNGANGTVNVVSGNLIIESATTAIGEKTGSTGLLNISGGSFTAQRESGGNSINVGVAGDGTLVISDGAFLTRAGLTLGGTGGDGSTGTGIFEVLGSNVDQIGIGSSGSIDGRWVQNANGILRTGIDAGGVTPVFVDDEGDNGSGGDVSFLAGAILDPYDLGDATAGVWHTVMTWEGSLTDSGLALSDDAIAAGWDYRFEGNQLQVQLTVIPEPASLGLLGLSGLGLLRRRR